MKSYNNFEKSSSKRISFIMATKNRGKILDKALTQIIKLKTPQDEFILIDGDSTDNTKKIVKKYQKYVDIFLSEPDLNVNHAYNKGIMLSSGKYIKYLCDDDEIFKEPLEKAIKIMDKNPEIGLLVCGGTRYRISKKQNQIVYLQKGVNYGKSPQDIFEYGTNGIGFIIRRSVYPKVGLAPFDWNADLVFAINCIKLGIVVKFCRLNLYYQTIYGFSINNFKKNERLNDYLELMKNNASKKFYYKFLINLYLDQSKLLKVILSPLIITSKASKFIFGKKKFQQKEYVWDGEFS